MLKILPVVVLLTLTPLSATAPSLSRYRNVGLGDTVAATVDRLQLASTDVKVLYQHPAVVQQITWRQHRFVSGTTVAADPLAEMVLTFHADRLARIVATYDRERTQGLTDDDLLELLSDAYGTPVLQSTTTRPVLTGTTPRHVIASWVDADTQVLLWREEYPRLVGLTITATLEDDNLQKTITEAARLAALGAPQRERDTQLAAAAAIKDRDERVRLENKARFKP
jgi:hypothetical protein